MKRFMTVAVAIVATAGSGLAFSDDGSHFKERLNGLKEAAAVVSTTGSGTFEARINKDETEIAYELTFQDLEGDVRQAHIHIGLPQNSGGIVLWLCDSDANPSPSANTPACNSDDPTNQRAGRVSGTLTAADVVNLPANGIAGATGTTPGEFAEVIALIRAGKTYANIHSVKFPPGEIRSQIDRHDGNDDRGHHH
jgi:CHRD domain-containing protein